jgi:hypothetical protein
MTSAINEPGSSPLGEFPKPKDSKPDPVAEAATQSLKELTPEANSQAIQPSLTQHLSPAELKERDAMVTDDLAKKLFTRYTDPAMSQPSILEPQIKEILLAIGGPQGTCHELSEGVRGHVAGSAWFGIEREDQKSEVQFSWGSVTYPGQFKIHLKTQPSGEKILYVVPPKSILYYFKPPRPENFPEGFEEGYLKKVMLIPNKSGEPTVKLSFEKFSSKQRSETINIIMDQDLFKAFQPFGAHLKELSETPESKQIASMQASSMPLSVSKDQIMQDLLGCWRTLEFVKHRNVKKGEYDEKLEPS